MDVERIAVRSNNVVQEYPDVADKTSLQSILVGEATSLVRE
jgi:hypothetical protein